jgi:uncharacterized membrane protein YqjE
MSLAGFGEPTLRLPMVELDEEKTALLHTTLKELQII